MKLRQLPAASARSASVNSTCTSFSASTKVAGDTSGPTGGVVPKPHGVPSGASAAFSCSLVPPTATPVEAGDIFAKTFLRDAGISLLKTFQI
jgi:hypothetical protein